MRAALKKPVPLIIGLAGAAAFAWGLYHLLLIGSCGGEHPECPPGSEKYFVAVMLGLPASIISAALGGGYRGITTMSTFGAVAVASYTAALSGKAEDPGQEGFLWVFGSIFALVTLAPVLLIPFALRKAKRAAALIENGTEAIGTVVEVRDTNVTINNNPRVALRFRVEPLSGTVEPFEAEKKVVVSRVDFPRVGDRYPVWFDPDDRERWAYGIDIGESRSPKVRRLFELAGRLGAAPPASAPAAPVGASADPESPLEKIARLNQLRMQGAITDDEFTAKKQQLLDAIV